MSSLDRNALESAMEPIVEIADDFPSLFLPIVDQVMTFLLHLAAPPRADLPPHQYSPYPLSELEYEDWGVAAMKATEMMLYIIVNYPEEFEMKERQPHIHALVGSLLGYQISGLAIQIDCTEWSDPNANVGLLSLSLYSSVVSKKLIR